MRKRKTTASAGLLVALIGVFALALSSTALAASPPVNTAVPIISPSPPHVSTLASVTTGSWNSEAPAHWLDSSGAQLPAGKSTGVTASGHPVTFAGEIAGYPVSLTCDMAVSKASLENPSGGAAGIGGAELAYSNCVGTGGWAGCEISPSGPVGASLALSTVEGQAKIAISPTGATLGTFTMSGKCALTGSHKVIGVINGSYSNAKSQIEFNAATTGGGALRFQSKLGPKATATGSIGLQAAEGGNIGADSMTYSYQWKRCSGTTCATISGATGSTYTPVAADIGKQLKVAVTATDSNGATSVDSGISSKVTASLSWYQESPKGSGAWLRPSSIPFSTSPAGITEFDWTSSGIWFRLTCSGTSGEGSLVNGSTQANVSGLGLTFTECFLVAPVMCEVGGGGKLAFYTLAASSPGESTTEPKRELKFVPQEGGTIVEFELTGCAYFGHYKFTGSFPAQVSNSGPKINTTSAEVKAAAGMHFGGSTGPLVGINSSTNVLTESPVKLDVAP
jgi:hypothetical protein